MFRSNVSIEMMIYECLMLMLMLCKSSYAKLTPEVLHQSWYNNSMFIRTIIFHNTVTTMLELAKFLTVR